MVKNPPMILKMQGKPLVRSLGREDPVEEGMETHSSILILEYPMDRGAWWATVHGVTQSRTRLSDFTFTFTFKLLRETLTGIGDMYSYLHFSFKFRAGLYQYPEG